MKRRAIKQNRALDWDVRNTWTEQKNWKNIWKRKKILHQNQLKSLVLLMEKGMFWEKVKQNTSWIQLILKFSFTQIIFTSVFEMLQVLKLVCWSILMLKYSGLITEKQHELVSQAFLCLLTKMIEYLHGKFTEEWKLVQTSTYLSDLKHQWARWRDSSACECLPSRKLIEIDDYCGLSFICLTW